ncbi:ArnT family glycosyltransferase [Lentiprolixibacter aurantiacus]|uniref:Glycosyltransferase family 39 protein n=1 Tax=Lentiprolixibacter aurantiacus TaxID=2993939 RepID=A0AAE3MJ20_9FLAO|nr:glycosyltransferase family 39 protein [Lentiprolixibacter aurantiacus]MCX2718221.1 glycosyltransferase family 39 protein [Lentiprolixibacter aurantiacus]
MISKLPRLFLLLLGAVLLINLVQAHVTPLIFDESYYWHYASNMAWGYFDHPPMVAALIKAGSLLFEGELGLRLFSCLMAVGTPILLWDCISNKAKNQFVPHFFVLLFSMTLFHAYGFLMLPDTPLLFFTALFLWFYKRFLTNPGIGIAIGLGLTMAALMYSKYHAILVILFVLLSNIRLVLNPRAWLAVLIALAAYTPHLVWLFENDFIPVNYHLFERPNRAYEFNDFTLGYFLNLVVLFGLTFPWVYLALFRSRPKDLFSRALVFLTYGVLLFFLVSSIQRRIQTQWLIVICVPMALLVFEYMIHNANSRKWIYRAGIANIAILFFLRIGLVYQPLFPIVYETHGNKEWVKEVQEKAGGAPVVFENSYRLASMFGFYSGEPSFTLNNIMFRKNQYSIDNSEEKFRGKKVAYISRYVNSGDFSFEDAKGTLFYGRFIEDFESFRRLEAMVDPEGDYAIGSETGLMIYNPYPEDIPLTKIRFGITYLNSYKQVKETIPMEVRADKVGANVLKARDTTLFYFQRPVPKTSDPSYFKITLSENGLHWGLNGNNVKIR